MADFSFIGKGELLLAPKTTPDKFSKVGNVSELKLSISEDEKSIQNFQSSGGGKANSSRRVTGVEFSMSMYDRNAENLALALRGVASAVAGGSATDEVHVGYFDKHIVLDKHVTPSTIVVKNSAGVTTYTLNTDYTVDAKGIIKILSTGTITDGQSLKISYAYVAHNQIKALQHSGVEWVAKFVGLNEAQTDKPVVVTFNRLKFGAAKDIAFISDDFSPQALAGEVLKEGADYFDIRQVEA